MSVRHVVLGKQTDGGYGLRCSPSGYDAGTNPVDWLRLSFCSDWSGMAPIYLSGTVIDIVNGATQTISFTSMGFIPYGYFMWRGNGTSTWWSLPAGYVETATPLLAALYISKVKIINNIGYNIDIAYAVFRVVTQ